MVYDGQRTAGPKGPTPLRHRFPGDAEKRREISRCARNDRCAPELLPSSLEGGERFDAGGELEDLDVVGAIVPVVTPADDDVAAVEGMAVLAVIAALELEFDVNALPAFGSDLALGLAIGESALNGFDHVAQFLGHHAEEKDDAVFVDGLVTEAAEVDRLAVDGAILEGCMVRFVVRRRRQGCIGLSAELLGRGGREKGHDVSPFRFVGGESAKKLRKR